MKIGIVVGGSVQVDRTMSIMTIRGRRRAFSRALLGSLLLTATGCGDDGSSEGSGAESSGSTGGTGEGTTESAPGTSTGEAATGDGTSTGPVEDGTSTGSGADTSGTAGSETGMPIDCATPMDEQACSVTEGCLWLGNGMNGECFPEDPSACELLGMQGCQQHPACDWNNQDGACAPV